MKELLKFIRTPIVGIITNSLLFMWLMPFGTFKYDSMGFYLCIVLAISLEYSIVSVLKKYQKDYLGKIK